MLIIRNPTAEQITHMIEAAEGKAVNWIAWRDRRLARTDAAFTHERMADMLGIAEYERGTYRAN